MKRISLLIIGLSTIGLVSCTSLLTENPSTELTETSVFNTEEGLEAQVYGILAQFSQQELWFGGMQEYLQIASGLITWKNQRTAIQWVDSINLTKSSSSGSGNENVYVQLYITIYRCNKLLDKLPSSPVDEDFKKEIEAEVKFYRAVCYYTATRMWGDVPLITSSAKTIKDTQVGRTAYYYVYEQVLKDLEFAEKCMRDSERAEFVAPGKGRPCKWAATSLKSSVYLTIGSLLSSPEDNFWDSSKDAALIAEGKSPRTPDFSACGIKTAADAYKLAFDTAEDVIQKGPYSLVPDYRTLFRWTEPGDWNLPERIFVLQSSNTSGTNWCSVRALPQYPGGTACVSLKNGNSGRIRPARFFYDRFVCLTGGTKGTGTNNKDLYYSSEDPRLDVTFYTEWFNQSSMKTLTTYPHDENVLKVKNADQYCNPYYKKYVDPSFNVTNGKADFYLLRLAEIYLISAEAAANLSSGKGDNYWNKAFERIENIHSRARKSHDPDEADAAFPKWNESDFTDKKTLVNAIIWERMCELAFEGHEYFDTHRMGAQWLRDNIAVPRNTFLSLPANKEYTSFIYQGKLCPTDVQDLRKSLLCAFPKSEISLDAKIGPNDQNDFYWD